MTIRVRDAVASDEAAWRELWAGYLTFYDTSLPEVVTAATWRRVFDPAAPIFARIAERDGGAIGFALCVLHEGTWVTAPICYLEDLFVSPAARRTGAGRALIDDLINLGNARGWSRLYWHSRGGNPARTLYDRFALANDAVHYQLTLSRASS